MLPNDLRDIKLLVLDIDGTMCLCDDFFPFTKRCIDTLNGLDMDYLVFTNNSSRQIPYYEEKFKKNGINVGGEKILLASHVVAHYLLTNHKGKTIYPVSTKAIVSYFENEGIEINDSNPDIVVVCFDEELTYEKLVKACRFIRNGAEFIAANPDIRYPDRGGGYLPDCGSIAKIITASIEREPLLFLGKPSKITLDYILHKTRYNENEVCFVGDRLYTDIAITHNTEAKSILVLTGEAKESDIKPYEIQYGIKPDFTLDSLEKLTEMVERLGHEE